MQAVQEDNQRKAAELESLRTHLQLPSSQKPVPPPFPSELASYSVQSEQAARDDHQTIVSPIVSPRRLPPPLSEEMMEEVMVPKKGLFLNDEMSSNDGVATTKNNATATTNNAIAPSKNAMTSPSEEKDANETNHTQGIATNNPSTNTRPIPSIGSPTKSRAKQPPPMPKKPASLLQEIQEAPTHVRLRKVPKCV